MSSAQQARNLCKTCGKPLGSALSVTQWISGTNCQCSKLSSAHQAELITSSTLTEHLCWSCGYPLKSGREGSFTQWIFRSKLCQCKEPILHRPGVPRSDVRSRYDKRRRKFNPQDLQLESAAQDEVVDNLFQQRYALLDEFDADCDSFAVSARDIVLSKIVSIVRFNPIAENQALQCQGLAKSLSSLRHPAIIPLLEFGIDEKNRPYFVADFVNELSLAELIEQEGTLPADTAFDITLKLCDCLLYAHSKGVFHGDLNSDNIFVSFDDSEPRLLLVEFGYSSVHALRESVTATRKPAAKDSQERNSDLMSLASLLYEMLSGSRPFQTARAGNLATTAKLESTDIEDPEVLNQLLSRVFSPTKQIAKIETIDEFKQALAAFLSEETPTNTTVEPTDEKSKTSKPLLWAIPIALVAGIAVTLAAVSLFSAQTATPGDHSWTNSPKALDEPKRAATKPKRESEETEFGNRYGLVDKVFARRAQMYSFENLDGKDPILGYLELSVEQARKIAALKTLNSIYIVQSDFSREAIEALSAARIRQLDALYCMFDDRCLASMVKNPKLETLKLMYVPVTDKGLEELKNCPNLRYLTIGPIEITAAGWRTIGELKNLKSLYVADVPTFTNSQLKKLADSRPKRLEQLKLYDTAITTGGYRCLSSIPSLKRLFLYRSNAQTHQNLPLQQLNDKDIDDLLENKKITELHLYNAEISGTALRKLLEAPHIEHLSYMGNKLPAGCLPTRKKTEHLKYLNICELDFASEDETGVSMIKGSSALADKMKTLVPIGMVAVGPETAWKPFAGGFSDIHRPYDLSSEKRTLPFKHLLKSQ